MSMTIYNNDGVRIEILSNNEEQQAVQDTLGRLGLTYDQLAEQASSDDFESERARRAWFMIRPL